MVPPPGRRAAAGDQRQRKEEIAQLRDGGVRDKHFGTLLQNSLQRSPDDGNTTERAEQIRCLSADSREHLDP